MKQIHFKRLNSKNRTYLDIVLIGGRKSPPPPGFRWAGDIPLQKSRGYYNDDDDDEEKKKRGSVFQFLPMLAESRQWCDPICEAPTTIR